MAGDSTSRRAALRFVIGWMRQWTLVKLRRLGALAQ
jgi:hypothetical protein